MIYSVLESHRHTDTHFTNNKSKPPFCAVPHKEHIPLSRGVSLETELPRMLSSSNISMPSLQRLVLSTAMSSARVAQPFVAITKSLTQRFPLWSSTSRAALPQCSTGGISPKCGAAPGATLLLPSRSRLEDANSISVAISELEVMAWERSLAKKKEGNEKKKNR